MKNIIRSISLLIIAAVSFTLFQSSCCLAQEKVYLEDAIAQNAAVGTPNTPVNLSAVITRVLFSLLLVIGILFICAYLVKKFIPLNAMSPKGSLIRVIDMAYLTPKKMIYIVEVADQILVLGLDTNVITLLTKIDDPQVKKALVLHKPAAAVKKSFPRILDMFLKNMDNKQQGSDAQKELGQNIQQNISDIKSQIDKLKDLKNGL